MKRFFCILLLILFALPCYAWEFQMGGEYEWQFNYLKRMGPGDMFGDADKLQRINDSQSNITSIGLAGPNNGQVVVEGLSSKGSDASWVWERLWFYPRFQVNRAVSVNGVLAFQTNLNGPYVGGPNWAAPPHRAGWYTSESRSETAMDALTSGVLRQLWVNMETPIGLIQVGRRTYNVGLGWSGIGGRDTAFNSIGITAPWGPLRFQYVIIPSDTGEATDPYDSRNVNLTPFTIASSTDRREMRSWNWLATGTYENGPLVLGIANRVIKYNHIHANPSTGMTLRDDMTGSFARPFLLSNSTTTGVTANTNLPVYGDALLMTNVLWGKYSNGRFFLNGEWDLQYLSVQREGGRSISGRPISWMMEGGGFYGPMKFTLAYFSRSGHDRQGGVFNVSESGTTVAGTQVNDGWNQYIVTGGSYTPLEPYTWLIGFYGGGNNAYDATGNPTYLDFRGIGARLDYAVASNLNFWGSYLYARRFSNTGNWLGQFTGGATPVPERGQNVPDTNLGQEIRVGTDWKLLEGMVWKFEFGIWSPGEWFKGAYRDYSSSTTTTNLAGGAATQTNNDRSIDPIIRIGTGIEVKF